MLTLQERIVNLLPNFAKKIFFPSWLEGVEFVKSIVEEVAPGSLVLDAGAGQCQYKPYFNKQKYIAIDAAIGEQKWNYSQLDAICDLGKTSFKSDIFDAIICIQVLEHVKVPQTIVDELFRILKPGGALFLSAPQGWGVHQAPYDFFRFTNYGLQYLFENSGFQINYIKPSCGYFGYLANRTSLLPKYLFWKLNPLLRIAFLPFEIISYILFVLIIPITLNMMDYFENERDYTLNYFVKGTKKIAS